MELIKIIDHRTGVWREFQPSCHYSPYPPKLERHFNLCVKDKMVREEVARSTWHSHSVLFHTVPIHRPPGFQVSLFDGFSVLTESSCALSKPSAYQKSCIKSYASFFPFPPPLSPSGGKTIPFPTQLSQDSQSANIASLPPWAQNQTAEVKTCLQPLLALSPWANAHWSLISVLSGSGKSSLTLITEGELSWESWSLCSRLTGFIGLGKSLSSVNIHLPPF